MSAVSHSSHRAALPAWHSKHDHDSANVGAALIVNDRPVELVTEPLLRKRGWEGGFCLSYSVGCSPYAGCGRSVPG